VETGTGMTVTPAEPVMVLDVVAEPDVVLTAMGKVDEPSTPVDEATTLEPVSLAGDAVALVSDSTMIPVLMIESVADAVYALSVLKWLERPEFMEEAALDKILENPEARDCVAAGSVAVAATPARSELNDEAKLERAADASLPPVVEALAEPSELVGLRMGPRMGRPPVPRMPPTDEDTVDEARVESSDPVGTTMGRPPVPRMPPVVEAPVDEA
jgi:hypothetical protein